MRSDPSVRVFPNFVSRQFHARPLATFAFAFLLGLILRARYAIPIIACAVLLALCCIAAARFRSRRRVFAAAMVLLGLSAGCLRMGLALDSSKAVPNEPEAHMIGRVASEPYTHSKTGRRIFRFDVESLNDRSSDLKLRMYIRCEDDDEAGTARLSEIEYGQRLDISGRIWASEPVSNPNEFDFGAYLHRQGLDAYGTAKVEDVSTLGTFQDAKGATIRVRQAIARRIDSLFPTGAGLMRALVLGDRSMLSDELREAMNRSGIAHLISISGLHVTVLTALIAFLLSRFLTRRVSNVIAVVLLIPYGAMIGFTAPFVRALTMYAILSFAPVVGLPSDPMTRLGAALLVWTVVRPLSIQDAGFVLSFSASAGIILLMPPIQHLTGTDKLAHMKKGAGPVRRTLRRTGLYIMSLICASLAAQLATLPAVISFFGVQPLLAIPVNLIDVPLCMLGYLSGLVVLVLSLPAMPLALLAGRVTDTVFACLSSVTRYFASIPFAGLRIGRYAFILVLIHWAIVVAASDLSLLRLRIRKWLPLALILNAALSSALVLGLSWRTSFVFLDVGQADSTVFRSRGHTFIIDVGEPNSPVADFLNATCLHVDGILLTHPHEDHAGGLEDVLNNFCPDVIYVPKGWFQVNEVASSITAGMEKARRMGVEIRELAAGDHISLFGSVCMDIYAPQGNTLPEDVNDLSLLAMITCDGQRALFTGDLSVEGEPLILPDVDILKVAHHGSDRATSTRFLTATSPEIAVISVGENNYGHPGSETLQRLAEARVQIYQTRQLGAVTLTRKDDMWVVRPYLEASDEVE